MSKHVLNVNEFFDYLQVAQTLYGICIHSRKKITKISLENRMVKRQNVALI